MWKVLLGCAVMLGAANTSHQKRYVDNGSGRNYAPDYGFVDPYEFHHQLSQRIMAQQQQQNRLFQEQFSHQQRFFDNLRRQSHAGAYSGASGSGSGHRSRYGFGPGSRYGPGYGNGGSDYDSDSYSDNYAPNYASASGSYGPGGGYQSAAVYPENPSVPNIDTRFSDDGNSGGGGYRGVSVSSYSSSSDVNGKKSNQRGASTTINDNGKVTTYRVHS